MAIYALDYIDIILNDWIKFLISIMNLYDKKYFSCLYYFSTEGKNSGYELRPVTQRIKASDYKSRCRDSNPSSTPNDEHT